MGNKRFVLIDQQRQAIQLLIYPVKNGSSEGLLGTEKPGGIRESVIWVRGGLPEWR